MTNPGANGTPGDSVARPAMGYTLRLLCIIMFMFKYALFMNTCTCYVSLTVFMILVNHLFNLGIKIYRNKPNYLIGGASSGFLISSSENSAGTTADLGCRSAPSWHCCNRAAI